MKRLITILCLTVTLMIPLGSQADASKFLGIPPVVQEKSNWCWAATGNRILWWYGSYYSQCQVHFAAQLNCFDTQDTLGGVKQAISILGSLGSNYYLSPLTFSSVKTDLDLSRPVGFRWEWSGGGGHIMLMNGYDQDVYGTPYVWYLDSLTGSQNYTTFAYVSGGSGYGHTWTHSLAGISR